MFYEWTVAILLGFFKYISNNKGFITEVYEVLLYGSEPALKLIVKQWQKN
jgi:hypothetical protein